MSEASKAVFLSYASQDAEAAKRICDALRAAGVEVWFDQSELVGGDQWDGKIRGQISSCALFMPVVSAGTQARREGYFRIEWKLAAQRTHAMADGTPFLVPVVIDETKDTAALVPAEFKAVQWTRLQGGEAPPAFCERVKKLLDGEPEGVGAVPRQRDRDGSGHKAPPAGDRYRPSKWWWALPIFGVTMALLLVMKEGRRNPAPVPLAPASVAETPATKTVARITAMLGAIDVTRAELDLAGDMLEQAVKSDPADAKLYATWAMLDCRYLTEYYDRSPTRLDAARRHAVQAGSLEAGDPLVRLARAFTMQQINDDPATRAEAAALLESVRTELPGDPRVLQQLGWAVAWTENGQAKAERWWAELAELPGQAAAAAFNRGLRCAFVGDFRAGYAAMADADALGKSTKVKLWKSYLEVIWLGDPAAAKRTMAEVPVEAFVEDMPATARHFVAYWSRDFELALTASRAVPREFLHSMAGMFPTGYIRGLALARLGRTAAAENEWRAALAATERHLASEPNDHSLLLAKGLLLVALGDKPAAAQIRRMAIELHGESFGGWSEDDLAAEVLPPEEAISRLQDLMNRNMGWVTAATLRLDPYYDRFRENPRFGALQAEADADPRLSPKAKPATGQKTEDREQKTVPTPSLSLAPSAPPDTKSVAVLAFTNLSDDKANEYFSDGISEELLNVLAKIPELKVSARTSAFSFKGKQVQIAEIARQLGVAYVVEGSVRKAGNHVRITAQLIKAADGFHVWSDNFDRELKDVFSVQDEIAGLIAKNLSIKMGISPARSEAINPEAYQHLFQARFYSRQDNNDGWQRSVEECKAALALDPDFALAAAEMARSYIQLARFGGIVAEEGYRLARGPAEHALAVDPDLAEAHNALGWVQRTADWNWAGADASFRRAYELAPRNATMLSDYAIVRVNQGDYAQARELARRALELDPLNANIRGHYSLFLGWFGDHLQLDEAVVQLKRAMELAPAAVEWHEYLARFQALQGRLDEAAATAELEPSERYRLVARALVLVARKDRAAAEPVIHELIDKYADAMSFYIAEIYSFAGENDRAFEWLERARRHRDTGLCWIRGSPMMKIIMNDPRWPELLKKLGHTDEELR